MSDFDLVVRGNIVDAEKTEIVGWLAVRDGKIAARGRGAAPAARETIDARGQWIVPGAVDGQVHSGSQANQEGIGWASRAAAAGGVTVMVDMPYDDPEPVACREMLDAKIKRAEKDSHVDVALIGTVNEKHGLEAIPGLIEGGVCCFKFSTFEAAPLRFPRLEEDDMFKAFSLIAPSGLACGVHNHQTGTRKLFLEPGPCLKKKRCEGSTRPRHIRQREAADCLNSRTESINVDGRSIHDKLRSGQSRGKHCKT